MAILIAQAIRLKPGVQLIKVCCNGHRCQKATPPIFDKPFDLALIITLAGTAKAICKQIMADQPGKGLGPLASAVAADLYDRQLGVVVKICGTPPKNAKALT